MPADPDDLSRERRPPTAPDDRATPPPTAERFLPPRRGTRNSRDTGSDSWYAAEWAGHDEPISPAEAEHLARRGNAAPDPDDTAWTPTRGPAAARRSASSDNSAGHRDGGGGPRPGAGTGGDRQRPGAGTGSDRQQPGTETGSNRQRPGAGTGSDRQQSGAGTGDDRQRRGAGAGGDRERAGGGSLRGAEGAEGGDPGSAQGLGGSGAQEGAEGASGPELARAVLDAALAKRRENAARNPRRRPGSGDGKEKRLRGYSGPGPDPRDPQPFGKVLERLMKARGWERPKAEATVFAAWEKVVGPDIAQHSRPVKLDAGVLTVEAESTAWATQLRLLTATLLRNIAGEVGHNVVTRLNIHGPAAPSWSRGPRRVQGRGPRDTYG